MTPCDGLQVSWRNIAISLIDGQSQPRHESFMAVTQTEFRKAMASFGTGVTVITVDFEGEVHGMTANAFASVSLDPLLVLVCVDRQARTHAHLHAKKRFGVNVLAENQIAIAVLCRS